MIQEVISSDSLNPDSFLLNLQECWYDSPIFRKRLSQLEESVKIFEANIKPALNKLSISISLWMEACTKMKSCSELFQRFLNEFIMCYKSQMLEEEMNSSTEYQDSDDENIAFDRSIVLNESDSSLKLYQKEEDEFIVQMDIFTQEFSRIEAQQTLLLQSILSTFLKPLEIQINYLFNDLKTEKKRLERLFSDYHRTLDKYMARRFKDPIIDVAQDVAKAKKEWYASILSYSSTLNQFHKFRNSEFIEMLFDFVKMFSDNSMLRKMNNCNIISYADKAQVIRQCEQLIEYHMPHMNPLESNSNQNGCQVRISQRGSFIAIEGYLYKKSTSSMRISWNRRYFSLNGYYLRYYSKHYKHSIPIDLRLCQLRICNDDSTILRRNCFELQSPIKSYWLQAENESELLVWVSHVRNAINNSLSICSYESDVLNIVDGSAMPWIEYFQKMMNKLSSQDHQNIRSISGNSSCADCSMDNPSWCCIMYGSLVCIECCGIHRGLGTVHSKVRSLILDHWESDMTINLMKRIGNSYLNNIYEENLDPVLKPKHNSPRSIKEAFIFDKYVNRRYIQSSDNIDDKLYQSILNGSNLLKVFNSLLLKGDIHRKVNIASDNDSSNPSYATLLHLSLIHNRDDMENILVSLLLLLWNCDPSSVDFVGRNAFHYAVMFDNPMIICYLVKKKGSSLLETKDNYGNTPYDLANTENIKSLLEYISNI